MPLSACATRPGTAGGVAHWLGCVHARRVVRGRGFARVKAWRTKTRIAAATHTTGPAAAGTGLTAPPGLGAEGGRGADEPGGPLGLKKYAAAASRTTKKTPTTVSTTSIAACEARGRPRV
jgi:hypothetical protein